MRQLRVASDDVFIPWHDENGASAQAQPDERRFPDEIRFQVEAESGGNIG